MRLEATGVRKSEGRYYERRGSVYERFLCALFATVVKPISDFRLLIYGLCVMLFALCSVAEAQPPAKVRRIGVLTPRSPSDSALWHQAFQQSLHDRGWVEGKNIAIEYRYAQGKRDRLPDLAADLLRLKVEVVVVVSVYAARAVQQANQAVPIVMASAADPVQLGLVASLARPGGNITGLSEITPEMAGKRLELLKEMVPKLFRVAVLWDPGNDASALSWKEIQSPASQLGLDLHSLEARSPKDFDKAFKDAIRTRAGALAVMPAQLFGANLKRIADLAAKSRLPSIWHLSEFADSGGLAAYGPDRSDQFRRAAYFVDKILKGAKPAELPVEQPMKFEFVINLKTAKQIGLTIPPEVLARANRLIK
jgi:putative ABC transport system substrate-binding protein